MVQGEFHEPIKCPKCKRTGNISSSIFVGAFGRSPTRGEYKCFNKGCGHTWKEQDSCGYAQYEDFDPY